MMKNKLFRLLFILYGCILSAQGADNSFHGYYKSDENKSLYDSFSFDGNGKVLISGLDYGDYFTRNDSLIIYPDKKTFVFNIKKEKLIGVSSGVEKMSWTHQKGAPEIETRIDSLSAKKKAELLSKYYDKTSRLSQSDLNLSHTISEINESFCQKGLTRTCLNLFEAKMTEYTSGNLSTPGKKSKTKTEPHLELILLSERIIELGEPEGYTVLGRYYYILGLKEKAFKTWEDGEKTEA